MQREIGSNFWLEPEEFAGSGEIALADFGIEGFSDSVLSSNGRSAEGIVLEQILREHPDRFDAAPDEGLEFRPLEPVGREGAEAPVHEQRQRKSTVQTVRDLVDFAVEG